LPDQYFKSAILLRQLNPELPSFE